MLPIKLAGLGWYLPARIVTNTEIETKLNIPPGWIERVTGVQQRHYATNETSAAMASAAARMALENAQMSVDDLDVIIGASTGPQQLIPCTAAFVQRELFVPEGCPCFDINATCLSFLIALHIASHLIVADVYRSALIFSSELISTSLNPLERESVGLFGDAAAACVITRCSSHEMSAIWQAHFETYSSGADLARLIGGGNLHHPNDPSTTPEMNMFHMDGPAIFKKAALLAGPFLDHFFSFFDWDRQTVDAVVPHQASGHAIHQLVTRLGFRYEQLVLNLALRGNCVAASIPLALAEAVHHGRIQRGNKVLLFGTGAGLSFGALALTF